MTTQQLRALMNAPGPVGPSSPIVAAALVALPRLLDVVEAAERWSQCIHVEQACNAEEADMAWAASDVAADQLHAAVAKWREG
jgi:hypothetical protein